KGEHDGHLSFTLKGWPFESERNAENKRISPIESCFIFDARDQVRGHAGVVLDGGPWDRRAIFVLELHVDGSAPYPPQRERPIHVDPADIRLLLFSGTLFGHRGQGRLMKA